MKKIIVFEEEEFKNKLVEFAKNFQKYSEKGYGCKLVSNEDGKSIDDLEILYGCFLLPWNDTFNDKKIS